MSTGSSAHAARRGGFLRLRDARIRAKLAGLLVLPLAAVQVLATVRLTDVGERASDAGRVADLAGLGTDLSNLTRLLHDERMAALTYLAGPDAPETGYREAVKVVDAQAAAFRTRRAAITEVPGRVADRLTAIGAALETLPQLRTAVSTRSGVTVADAARRYGDALTGMAGYEAAVSRIAEPGTVADRLRALAAFNENEAAAAQQAAVTYLARVTNDFDTERQRALIAAQANRADAVSDFRAVADTRQNALADTVLGNEAVTRADALTNQLTGPAAVAPDEVLAVSGDVIELLRGVERQLESQAVSAARSGSTDTSRRATLEFVLVLLVLLAAVALAVYIGRALTLSVRRLREGALAVANRELPDAVQRLQDADNLGEGGVDRIITQTRDPIPVTEQDEFGQVAEAFNMVHREAIRVAAEQAALRTSLSTMFLSLARRSQALVDRMIGELDQIERLEEDPKRLARLFELDHLATRMRRNDENLLVLAGAEVGAPRREDALLVDALRAAQSEVELYHRIEFGSIDTDVLIAAAAVNDVVRLIAELLDNATRFSPPNTVVMAHGSRSGDQAVVQVEDRGLGISAEQMTQINRRLTEPTEVDVSAFRLMGFAVIGRLAARHGITVELRPGYDGGTIAEVTLPADVAVLPGAPAVPARAGSWTRPGPPPPQLSAAPSQAVEARPPVRSAPMPAQPVLRSPLPQVGPITDLDLRPTPDRPPLPARMPSPGWGEAVAALPPMPEPQPEPAAPVPIRVEMQLNWFDGPVESPVQGGMPTAGYAPPPAAVPPVSEPPVSAPPVAAPPVSAPVVSAAPISVSPVSASPVSASPVSASPDRFAGQPARRIDSPAAAVPKPRPAVEDRWRTTADDGWQRAMAAAAPPDAGSTRSGLPIRVPQAQLVPGGVRTAPRNQHRRNPDEVRGLLSSYHRGVQRGRTDGVAESAAAATHAPKENEQ